MSTRHIAAQETLARDLTPEGSGGGALRRFRQKLASDGFIVDEGWRPRPGFTYTVVRAISARVNQNYDGWPSSELKKAYKTFIGKPCFVNHENHDPTKARGVIVAARYAESGMDKYIETVMEIDAQRFPKLAHEIQSGGLDSVSMGAEAGFTICSYCHNKATDLHDMCSHVQNHKGKTLSRLDRKTGKREEVLVFESCHKISFFELSYVFEPADETAVASKVVVAGLHKHAGDCPPGMDCSRGIPGLEQITKDSPNNPVNQVSNSSSGGGGGGGGKGGSSPTNFDISQWNSADDYAKAMSGKPYNYGGAAGNPNGVDCSGYMSDIYSIYSGKPTRFTTDSDFSTLGFQPGYQDGAFNIGTNGGLGENGHMAGTLPNGTKVESNGSNGVQYGGNAIGAQDFTQQWHYPVSAPATTTTTPVSSTATTPASPGVAPTTRAAGKYTKDDFAIADGKKPWERDAPAAPGESDDLKEIEAMIKKASGGPTWIPHIDPDGNEMPPPDPSRPVYTHFYWPAAKKLRETGEPQPNLWSVGQTIPHPETGKMVSRVHGYTDQLHLTNPEFRVAASGNARSNETGTRNVHAKVYGMMPGPVGQHAQQPDEPRQYSGVNYDPFTPGKDYFYHRDNNEPIYTADHAYFGPNGQTYASADDNWGRDHPPSIGFAPADPSVNAANPDSVVARTARLAGVEWIDAPSRQPTVSRRLIRSAALKKIARNSAIRLAYGEVEAPARKPGAMGVESMRGRSGGGLDQVRGESSPRRGASRTRLGWGEIEAPVRVDTLRQEGTAPEDDNNDDQRYVDPADDDFASIISSPAELQTPDFSEASQIDREQQQNGGDQSGVPGPAEGGPGPQDQGNFITLKIPVPAQPPQVPQQAGPPVAVPPAVPPQAPAGAPPPPGAPPAPAPVTASVLDYFDGYYGRRVANWLDAVEAGRRLDPAEVADYRRQTEKFSTLENGRELSTTDRYPRKGTANMARTSIANRNKVATAGRRQHFAEGPLVDGGDRSRNDQGEQEEAFLSQTPPEVPVDFPTDDAANISNTEHNLVARVQQGRAQLLRDAEKLASVQRQRRAFDEAGGPTAEVVDPRVNAGAEAEALTGTGFVSADPNDGVAPTNPKDASLRAFRAFDGWLSAKTGKSSRRHTEATIKKAAAAFSREAGISPQVLFPALGVVLREARKNDKNANTKGAKMRKRADEKLEVAAPDGRVDVEAPVSNTTDAEAQASQFDLHDFGNNAGDNVADPDLSTDQNWAPGEASKTSARVKTAGGLLAMRCAEGMIEAGLEPNSRERKYQLAAEFEGMNRGLIQDRVALLERFAAVRQAERRKVASGDSRGAARSPIPAGLGGGTRTAAGPSQRLAAHDPSNDSTLFI